MAARMSAIADARLVGSESSTLPKKGKKEEEAAEANTAPRWEASWRLGRGEWGEEMGEEAPVDVRASSSSLPAASSTSEDASESVVVGGGEEKAKAAGGEGETRAEEGGWEGSGGGARRRRKAGATADSTPREHSSDNRRHNQSSARGRRNDEGADEAEKRRSTVANRQQRRAPCKASGEQSVARTAQGRVVVDVKMEETAGMRGRKEAECEGCASESRRVMGWRSGGGEG